MKKRTGCGFAALLLLLLASCASTPSVDGVGPVYYLMGDDPARARPGGELSGWTRLETPGLIDLEGGDGYFWLRLSVQRPAFGPVWLETGKIDCAFDLYSGGSYLGSHGGLPPRYHARAQLNTVILLPDSVFSEGEAELALRCYYSGSRVRVPGFSLADADRADLLVNTATFLVSQVNVIIAVLCLFMGAYFIAGFASHPEDRASLYFALSLLLVAVYFLDMGSERVMIGGLLQRAVARSCLAASMAFELLFFITYFEARGSKAAKIFAVVDIAVFTLAYLAFRNDDAVVNLIFNLSLAPIFGIIVIVFIIILKAAKAGKRDALPMLIGLAVGVGFSLHDIAFQVSGNQPFAWLQGFTFFSLNLSIFIAIALRSAMMRSDLDAFAKAVSEQRDRMSRLLAEAERASEETQAVAAALDGEVGAVAEASKRSTEAAGGIRGSAEAQRSTLDGAATAIKDLLASIASVRSELGLEAASIERSTRDTASLIDGVAKVGAAIDASATFAGGLGAVADSGRAAMSGLAASMERIRASSDEIRSVIEAVNEIADRTNLLAMNASIEAAHAGAAGRGFAVIAHEIKALAQASAERSARIGPIVAGIASAVSDGVASSKAVSDSFLGIADGATRTGSMVAEAAAEAARQRQAGEGIAAESRTLAASAVKMMGEADRQSALSAGVSDGLHGLETSQEAVAVATADILSRTAELERRVASLKALAGRARNAADALVSAMNG